MKVLKGIQTDFEKCVLVHYTWGHEMQLKIGCNTEWLPATSMLQTGQFYSVVDVSKNYAWNEQLYIQYLWPHQKYLHFHCSINIKLLHEIGSLFYFILLLKKLGCYSQQLSHHSLCFFIKRGLPATISMLSMFCLQERTPLCCMLGLTEIMQKRTIITTAKSLALLPSDINENSRVQPWSRLHELSGGEWGSRQAFETN